jgi:hypothetical protein
MSKEKGPTYDELVKSLFTPVDKIVDNLYLGNRAIAEDKKMLDKYNIRYIIQATKGPLFFPNDKVNLLFFFT